MASRTTRAVAQLGQSVGQVEEAVESLASALGDALGDRLPALAGRLADRFPEVAEQLGDRFGDRVPALQRYTSPGPSGAENALAFIGGLLAGALVGGIAAAFLAPSDGKTFRDRLQSRVDELMGYTLPPDPAVPAPAPEAGPPFAPVAPGDGAGDETPPPAVSPTRA